MNYIHKYAHKIREIYQSSTKEHSFRTPLENLLNNIAFNPAFKLSNISIVQESSDNDLEIEGTPDFFVYRNSSNSSKTLVGFVECKKINYNLTSLAESAQIKKYSKIAENIIITNYKEFFLLHKGVEVRHIKLLNDDLSLNPTSNIEQEFINFFQEFFGFYQNQYIKNKKSLALALANQSFYYAVALKEFIKNTDFIKDEANRDKSFHEKFTTLFNDFQKSIQYSYQLEDFCDIYSQSLVYGLLLAKLENNKEINEDPLEYLREIPIYYRLLREFLSSGYQEDYIPPKIKASLLQVGKNLNLINVVAIEDEFAKNNEDKNSIAVYLYEDFLKAYDNLKKTESRKENGVYYTPKEVADFIVKAINFIIKDKFNEGEGFLARGVKTLDFACGTGTFLESLFRLILQDKAQLDDLKKSQIKSKILNDIYGFELLFTPYIVAHTILSKQLRDLGITIDIKSNKERLGIYLTNSLDIDQHSISGHMPNLKQEHEKSTHIKNQEDILAIIGNPPYFNGKSQALSKIIDQKINDSYKKNLKEKKINLDDLYIKFIKLAEYKIAEINKSQCGVVGIITNNSFLDGVTHRKMRESLYNSFDEIYILNLHGNARKKENDQNVFDIMVGVNISFFIKHTKATQSTKSNLQARNSVDKKVYYFSTKDNNLISRKDKLNFLCNTDFKNVDWQEIQPQLTENFWFINKDLSMANEYQNFHKITDIFKEYNSGIESQNDKFLIPYKLESLEALKKQFQNLPINEIISLHNLKDSRDWKISNAQNDIKNNYNPTRILYRAFDFRFTSLNHKAKGFLAYPRYDMMRHFDGYKNLGICFERGFNLEFKNCFISERITDSHLIGSKTYIAPLYLYQKPILENDLLFDSTKNTIVKLPNFTSTFTQFFDGLKFKSKPTPENIMAYIYAILHCPLYRQKYLEFLKTDFPAIPFTQDEKVFYNYANLGQKLIDFHLLKNLPDDREIKVSFDFEIDNFNEIFIEQKTPPTPTSNKLILQTNAKKFINFDGISKDIYDFEIGSYRPIDKWLTYRINDKVALNLTDIEHLKNMIIAIKNTQIIMNKIGNFKQDYLKQ